jgi:hypothetical protein
MRERIAKSNLTHDLFFGKSSRAMRKIFARPNHGFFFGKSNRIKGLLNISKS